MDRIIIIGAGPGGYETAIEAAKQGIEVTLITDGPLGGTCLNEGCIPTKTLVNYASCLSLAEIQQKKQEVVNTLQSGIASLLKNKLITLVNGHVRFVNDNEIEVETCEDQSRLSFDISSSAVIIATGSISASLPIPGADKCITSREILELTEVPKSLCVIGGGVIGLEFASIFNRLGSKVTALEYAKQILPRFDTDLCKRLKQNLTKQGIEIKTDYKVEDINNIDDEVVLMAVGRRPNIENLGLENTSISFTKRGIEVDDNMQTSVKNIYAIGDVNARMMLAHVATFQGKRALNHITGKTDNIRFNIVPSAVFTVPELATVGMTEEQCKEQNIPYKTYKSFFRANGKAVSMGETEGYCKILAQVSEIGEDRILGAHIFGAHSSDIIHEITVLMNLNGTLNDLKDIIHAHPTLSEVILSAIA